MKLRSFMPLLACGALSLALTACGDSNPSDPADTSANGAPSAGVPPGLLAESAPDNALSVVEARSQAAPGESITLRGKVGGKASPIADTAAVLVLADEKAITSCDDIPGDTCPTPWDFCCEESATIAASTATIQVRDDQGKPLRTTLRGLGGLKELSRIIVSGTVDPASTDTALIVNADTIHVEKP